MAGNCVGSVQPDINSSDDGDDDDELTIVLFFLFGFRHSDSDTDLNSFINLTLSFDFLYQCVFISFFSWRKIVCFAIFQEQKFWVIVFCARTFYDSFSLETIS